MDDFLYSKRLTLNSHLLQIHPSLYDTDAFARESCGVFGDPAKRKRRSEPTVGKDDAVAGDVCGIRIVMEEISNMSWTGDLRAPRHIAVRQHESARNGFHNSVDALSDLFRGGRFHDAIVSHPE